MKAAWICVVLSAAALRAQSFEVSTVKPTPPGTREFRLSAKHGTLTGRNITVQQYIGFAYDLNAAQIEGGPDWLRREPFDIVAKGAPGTSDEQVRTMLQGLLAERFGLQVRHEKKEMPVFVLTVAKGGPKLHKSEHPDGRFRMGRGHVQGEGVSLEDFAAALAGRVGRQILDETHLAGAFDIELNWTPEAAAGSMNPDEAAPDPNGASLFAAIREQLGLRLEGRKAPVDILVVDHVERTPTEN